MKRNYVIGSVVVVVLLLALFFINPFQQSKKRGNEKAASGHRTVLPSSPLIKVEPGQAAPLPPNTPVTDDPNFVSGVVEPYLDVTLGLVVQGRIDKINFPEGRKVPRGGVILNLEKSQEELEVARRKIIWMNHAELKSAEVTVSTLTESLKLNRKLYDETRSVSKEELDKLSLQWENAVADRDRLLNQEQREKVEYDMAVKVVESRLLKAPVTGVVEKVFLKAGEVYQPGQPLVRLIDSDRCLLTANLDDTRSYTLKKGMVVDLLINVGATEVKKKGVITKVPSVVDPASGVMQVKVVFENSDGGIKPGVTARMRLPEQ
jgi:RND family efflux transporter MFP subunit